MTEQQENQANAFFRQYPLNDYRAVASPKSPKAHQQEALAKLSRWYSAKYDGARGAILVLPTGGGKTFTAVRFLCRRPLSDGYKVLWLAHTHHLLEQAMHAFDDSAGSICEPKAMLGVRVVSGATGHCKIHQIKPSDDVVVGSLQAICKAVSVGHEAVERFVNSANSKLVVVFDEAHHSPAPSYRRLLQQLREVCPEVIFLGLTATPFYSDEKRAGWLRKLFPQEIIHQVTANALMASGVLSQPIVEEARTMIEPEFSDHEFQKWVDTNQDIPEHIVTNLAKRRERNEFIADYYTTHRKRLGKTIIFADRWTQCEMICTLLKERGVRADAVFSQAYVDRGSPEERNRRTATQNAEILEKFKNNELDVLVNVRMLTEGTDVPDVQSVFLTRQTTSQSLLVQMIGRALRGPAVGGTEKAYIVSFIDDWQQRIKWADYAQLAEGQADEAIPEYSKRPPIQLISIDLIRRLTHQMDSGIHANPEAFTAILPVGWYRVEYDALVAGSDEIESVGQMVLVYERDKPAFERFIDAAVVQELKEFEEPSVGIEQVYLRLETLASQFFQNIDGQIGVSLSDLLSIVRHIAQNEKAVPRFFAFEERSKHNLDTLAERFIAADLGPKKIDAELRNEFARQDLFWSAIYSRYDQFRSTFDGRMSVLVGPKPSPSEARKKPEPENPEPHEDGEPSNEVKQQVFVRDQHRCLCCGSTKRLRIDHIKPSYHGGSNDIENLQSLCDICNGAKLTHHIDFRLKRSALEGPPAKSPEISIVSATRRDTDAIDSLRQGLQRWINLFYRCSAVDALEVEENEAGRRIMKLRLRSGVDRSWLEPHLSLLRESVHSVAPTLKDPSPNESVALKTDSNSDDVEPVMATNSLVRLDEVLDAIEEVEGFRVRIRNSDDRKVRGDLVLRDCPLYPFRRKLNETKTVNTWKIDRLFRYYPIFDSIDYRVEVLDADGTDRPGNTKLRSVRDSYFW